ncbi:MAG TPA: CHAT domain-containing protein, partial [Bryobacteraceae bacterium]
MRWWALLLVLSGAGACSRRPSAQQTYAQAWSDFQQGKLSQAQEVVNAALERRGNTPLDPDSVRLELLHAEILLGRRQTADAWKILNALAAPPEPGVHLRWIVDRADAMAKTGHNDQARLLLDEADRLGNTDSDSTFKALMMRGALLARGGDFDRAEASLQQTAARAASAGNFFYQSAALLNLSFSKLKRARYDESIAYAQRAREIAMQGHASQLEALANNNLGINYTVLHDLDRAEQYQNAAIQQLREIGDLGNLQDALGELGNVHLLGHRPAPAVQDFQQAVEVARRVDATPDAARWAGQLALAFIDEHNWSEAESWNRQARSLYGKLDDPYLKLNDAAIESGRGHPDDAVRLYRELIAESPKIPYLEWNAHVRLGSLLADQRQFPQANAEYELGLKVIEQVRSGLLQDDSRLTYYSSQIQFFKDYVELLVSEGRQDRALQVAEYSRARVLAERLGLQPGTIEQVRPERFRQYAQRSGETIVSFWLAPRRSFAWVIKPGGIQMKELPGESQIGDAIRAYRKAIEEDLRDPVETRMVQGERLSAMLLGPLREDLAGAKRVIVVPDGALHALNLETLPAAEAGRYWIEDVELSIAPSLSVLADAPPAASIAGTRVHPVLLLIGAPESAAAEYPELPAARAEIAEIQGRFATEQQVIHTGQDATPRAFLDSMPARFSMIHFAAHAETNPERPLESAVILSPSGEGYKLYARDIAALKLSADLVTISACRSAGSRTYGGEGLVGFAWAFLQAGT